jgi:hypothetical protein
MSRAPIKQIPHSNGHGLRPAYGGDIPRRQIANLVTSAAGGLATADLRKKLLAEIEAEARLTVTSSDRCRARESWATPNGGRTRTRASVRS